MAVDGRNSRSLIASACCDCGALEVSIMGAPVAQLVCHCKDCQHFSGMPYIEAAFYHADDVFITGQASRTTLKGATGMEKTYNACEACGVGLYSTLGALNGATAVLADRIAPGNFEPQAHIWVSEKAEGIDIPEGITQTQERPPKEIVDAMISRFWGDE